MFRDLIDAYTPAGKKQEAIGILQAFFARAGIPTTLQQVDEDRNTLRCSPRVAELLRFLLAAIEHFKGRGDRVIYHYRNLSSSPQPLRCLPVVARRHPGHDI